MTSLEAALAYARNKFRIFPLYASAKNPRIENWQNDASCEADQVARWWAQWPSSNIGLALDGLTALDIDPRHGGLESLATLEAEHGTLDPRARQRSGSGGWHYLFQPSEGVNTARGFRSGLDLLTGSGSYIVVAPSVHPSGGRYEWTDEPTPLTAARDAMALTTPPQWLLDAAGKKPRPIAKQVSADRLIEMALEKIRAGEGRNNAGLWFFAQLRDNGYSRDDAALSLRDFAGKANQIMPSSDRYTLREAEATLRSAFKRDAREPWDTDGKDSQADILLKLTEDFEYFRSGPANDAYVRMVIGGHREVWRVDSKSPKVREILTHRFLQQKNRAPGRDALNTAIDTVLARCGASSPKVDVHVRFARGRDAIYLDLCDDQWRAVEVTAAGWHVIDRLPVLFKRPAGARALPVPVPGGSLEAMRPLLNSGDDTQWRLMVAWLVGAFLPDGAFAHLVLEGEQGSAKSTTARVLQSLLDPSDGGLSAPPKDETDATVSALHAGILAYDNLSGCRAEIADVFCRFSTGQGYRTRTLYENLGVTIAAVKLPVLLNGIDSTVMRGDLLERSIILKLPRIAAENRLTEQGIWSDFAAIHPIVLGALLDAVSCGLRNLPSTTLIDPPRMSDFCTWVTACEPALPWKPGSFIEAYRRKLDYANRDLAESDPVASAIVEWADRRLKPGTAVQIGAKDLLIQLNQVTSETPKDMKYWPLNPESLAHKLRRLAPVLRAQGLDVPRLPRTGKLWSRWELSHVGPQKILLDAA